MVLCVSNIFWSPASVTDGGLSIEPYPELEVTDGWYRLRARIDLAMARAVRRGVIRVGRKIGVAGAKVCIPS
jgi:breast cancer 2 susceptibility protein